MPSILNWRGELVKNPGTPILSAANRGYRLGESVFETIRVYNGRPFALKTHLRRLSRGCELLKWQLPADLNQIEELIFQSIAASAESSASLRLTVTAAEVTSLNSSSSSDLSIFVAPLGAGIGASYYPASAHHEGIVTKILQTPRPPASCWPMEAKFGNYLGSLWARNELKEGLPASHETCVKKGDAVSRDLIEGIQLGTEGDIVSGTVSNIFLVSAEQELITPPLTAGALAGVIRETVLGYAAEQSLQAFETPIKLNDLATATEVFFTNSLMELLPVREVLGQVKFADTPGPITRQLHSRYLKDVAAL